MKRLPAQLWLLAFIPLLLISVTALSGLTVAGALLINDRSFQPDPTVHPWHLVTAIILSVCTTAYCAIELIRTIRGRSPLLKRWWAVLLILAGLIASQYCVTAGDRKRSADTTIIPELALPHDSEGGASPKPKEP